MRSLAKQARIKTAVYSYRKADDAGTKTVSYVVTRAQIIATGELTCQYLEMGLIYGPHNNN